MTMANETSSEQILFILLLLLLLQYRYYYYYYYYYYYLVLILYVLQVGTSHKSKDIRGLRVKIQSRILLVLLQQNLFFIAESGLVSLRDVLLPLFVKSLQCYNSFTEE